VAVFYRKYKSGGVGWFWWIVLIRGCSLSSQVWSKMGCNVLLGVTGWQDESRVWNCLIV
jgi:hypothetical protein